MKLVLVTFEGCPNAERARALLNEGGLLFTEIRQDDLPPSDPLHGYSSPTLLTGEKIVFGSHTSSGASGCTLAIPTIEELKRMLPDAPRRTSK